MAPYSKETKKGDVFTFGCYGPKDTPMLPISWRVLDVEENRILVLSERILAMRPFHNDCKPIRWEDSSLRWWLNHKFLEVAFTPEERELICDPEPGLDPLGAFLWQMHGLETTTASIHDRVFVLCHSDIYNYFPDTQPMFHPGSSAKAADNLTRVDQSLLCWWLRTSSSQSPTAYIVSPFDSVGMSMVERDNLNGVRPAMWLRLV